jgi:site-specific DNA recombinase
MDTKQKVAIYARVSSQEQATEGVSIEAQVAALKAYAKSQGWEIADEYVDAGYSGSIEKRPSLQRLLSDARQGQFTIIAVAKLDRFFRNLRLLLNHLYEFDQLGIKFVATQEMLDTSTPYGKFAMQIMGVIAEFERGRIGERVRDSRHYLIAQGRWAGGRTLYGYRWIPGEKKWEIDEKEAGVVRYIYHLYVNEGMGTMKILSRLNEEDYRTRSGYRWGFHTLYKALTHPGYKGLHPSGLKVPPIIDEETWEMAQEKRIKARQVRRDAKHWLLQGLCICGECGHTLYCIQKDRTERRYYSCRGRDKDTHLDGSLKCTLPRVRADLLEKAVWRRLKNVLTDSDTLKKGLECSLEELKQKRTEYNNGTGSVDRGIASIAAKKERLGLAYADGAITGEVYQQKLRTLKKMENKLLQARSNLNPELRAELSILEQSIAGLEKALNGKAGRILLTELGIWMEGISEGAIGCTSLPVMTDGTLAVGVWDEPAIIRLENFFRLGYNGPLIRMVDAPEVPSHLEVSRDRVWQTIRGFLESFKIKVYVFRDRVEIRGLIPIEVLEIPRGTVHVKREAIISLTKGRGYRG